MQRYWPHGYCFYETSKVKNLGSYSSNLSTSEGEAGGWPPVWGQWGLQIETLSQRYSRFRTYSRVLTRKGPGSQVRWLGSGGRFIPPPLPSSPLSSSCLCLPFINSAPQGTSEQFCPLISPGVLSKHPFHILPWSLQSVKEFLELSLRNFMKNPGLLVDWTGGGAKALT